MKAFLKRHICSVLLVALLLVLAAGACFGLYLQIPKFHDITLELGSPLPKLTDYLGTKTVDSWARFVTDPAAIQNTVGRQEITLSYLGVRETVALNIQDTKAPEASFQDVTLNLDQVPTPELFVKEAFDLSGQLEYSFVQDLGDDQADCTVQVAVSDPSGNKVTGSCKLTYEWLKKEYTAEYGTYIQAANLLLDSAVGEDTIAAEDIQMLNDSKVGQYVITAHAAGKDSQCTVTIQDTTPPTVVLKDVSVYRNRKVKLSQFVVSATDLSGDVELRLVTTPDTSEYGTFPITIEAEDIYGNIATVEGKLLVVKDKTPPSFKGLSTMKVKKNSTPDYTKGVSASDKQDGAVEFTYNASAVNLKKAGTYYVTYTATDSNGNTATKKRTVKVLPDKEDTDALVKEHAKKCGTTVQQITKYVKNLIKYNTNWGGDDPVYYGFTNKKGNCYVHALCLQRLMTAHGYTTKLIWVTNKTHYWLIVDMGGYWRHIDATPGHYSDSRPLMTDAQRYKSLYSSKYGQRNWDRSKWPACE